MSVVKNSIALTFLILCAELLIGQGLPNEIIVREVNRQLFDTDGNLPGFHTLTNKYHKNNYGRIKSESIVYPNNERVVREFNQKGSMVKYQVYREDKLNDDFTYAYADDGISLLRERGTYNLDYFHVDSVTYFGLPVLGSGRGFNYDLDTLFVHESKSRYELTRKWKSKDKVIKRYESKFTENGSLLSATTFRNDVQTGHVRNQYNELHQVIEREDFDHYFRFATEDEWSAYIYNLLYKFVYDTNGYIKSLTTEIYNVSDRRWEVEVQEFVCNVQTENNRYIANCVTNDKGYIKVEIDYQGNWIRKEEYANGELKVTTREITYYE